MDRFRSDANVLSQALARAGASSDEYGRRLVDAITTGGLFVGIGTVVLVSWAGYRQYSLRYEMLQRTALYYREKEIGDALQNAVIARDLPSVPGLKLDAHYRAAVEPERVGGDWYDAFPMSNGQVFVTIGDVMGHGIAAMVGMNRLRSAIIASALHETDPGAILSAANRRALAASGCGDRLVGTAICAFIDPASYEVVYSVAGHPPPVVASCMQGAFFLKYGGLPLGLDEAEYQTYRMQTATGSLLIFYTDGLTEFGHDLIEGERRLLETARHIVANSIADRASAVMRGVLREALPGDDIAIVTATFVDTGFHDGLPGRQGR